MPHHNRSHAVRCLRVPKLKLFFMIHEPSRQVFRRFAAATEVGDSVRQIKQDEAVIVGGKHDILLSLSKLLMRKDIKVMRQIRTYVVGIRGFF